MSNRREPIRIGLICGALWQAGTERYVFELCRGLDKTRFSVELLTIVPWGVGRQYYADPIRQLGIPIRPLLPLFHFRSLSGVLRTSALAMQEQYRSRILPKLLARYDLLVVVHLDYWSDVAFMLPPEFPVVLHLTTHLVQHDTDYYRKKYPGDHPVFLVCMDDYQAHECLTALAAVNRGHTVVPLPIDSSGFEPITEWPRSTRPIIGTFMRVEHDRDHLTLLRTFALLAKQYDAELRCYGRGDPAFLRPELERLGIADRVRFPGHVKDMRQTVIDDRISLAWLTTADEFMGYSALELSLWSVPIYFYNTVGSSSPDTVLRRSSGAVHSYKIESELAQASLSVLQDSQELREVGRRLRQYALDHNDSSHVMRKIESFYENVVSDTRLSRVRWADRLAAGS